MHVFIICSLWAWVCGGVEGVSVRHDSLVRMCVLVCVCVSVCGVMVGV